MRLTTLISVCTVIVIGQAPRRLLAQTQDAAPILSGAIAAFQRVTTLRADFTQTIHDEMIGSDAVSRGEYFQQRPNKLALRFRQPAGDMIVVDGTWFWGYFPSTAPGQVVKSAVSGMPGQTPDVIADFLERPTDRFTVTFVRSEPVSRRPADVLAFVPRRSGGAYRRVLLWIDRADSLPHQVEITEASGAVRRFTFDRLRVNAPLPPSTFVFRPPANVRVVDASTNE